MLPALAAKLQPPFAVALGSPKEAAELVASHQEFKEWVKNGVCARLKANPVAMFFLRRQAVHMPAYRDSIPEADLEALDSLYTYARVHDWSARRRAGS